MKLIDRTGKIFGRLTVFEKSSAPKMWHCVCLCGVEVLVSGSNLDNGSTKSCGCLAREWGVKMGSNPAYREAKAAGNRTHGQKPKSGATVEYKTWLGMKRRCYDARCKDFPNWGGRGIRVCDQWRDSFERFFADMGRRPDGDYSIDRLDSSKDYSPENCRWATIQQQGGENRRGLVPVTVNGVHFATVKHACVHFGVGISTALQRIYAGIDPAQAVSDTNRLKSRRTKESYWKKSQRQ